MAAFFAAAEVARSPDASVIGGAGGQDNAAQARVRWGIKGGVRAGLGCSVLFSGYFSPCVPDHLIKPWCTVGGQLLMCANLSVCSLRLISAAEELHACCCRAVLGPAAL